MGASHDDPEAWRQRGRSAARHGSSLLVALTRNPDFDVFIKQGWDQEQARLREAAAKPRAPTRRVRRNPQTDKTRIETVVPRQGELFGPRPPKPRRLRDP